MYQTLPIDGSPSPLKLNRRSNLGKVIIKSAPKYRLDNERDVLKHFHARPGIRPLLDETQDPPSLVLKHLEDNLLTASNSKSLEKPEVKFIAKRILEALQAFHEELRTATYILMSTRIIFLSTIAAGPVDLDFREVELGDCDDVCRVIPKDHLKVGENGPMIEAHMFRSPEAMLNLRWGTPTDIWSFGTKQIAFFGPFPLSYFDFLLEEDERWEFIGDATQYIMDNQTTFICKIMKLDPRDRPAAQELSQDPWLIDVQHRGSMAFSIGHQVHSEVPGPNEG